MKVGALVIGMIGGLISLLYGVLGYGFGGIVGLAYGGAGTSIKVLSLLIPISALAGAGVVLSMPLIGGLLMGGAAIGFVAILGFNVFTLIPVVLLMLAALLALFSPEERETKQSQLRRL
jgi:hypothetical protein